MSELTSNPICPNCAKSAKRFAELEAAYAAIEAAYAKLKTDHVKFETEIIELKAKLQQNSSNSSNPPSSDPPWQKQTRAKESSGRKPGGQPGHCGHHRERLPPERLKTIVPYIPKVCAYCQASLPQETGPSDPPPSWHQVAELPEVVVEVTEHQGHARACVCCGKITCAEIPADIRAHTIGPNLAAALSYLSGRCHDSKRNVQEIAEMIFNVQISLGTIIKLETEMSKALAGAHAEALVAVRAAPVKNVDETGWSKQGKLCWLWVAATLTVVVFQVHVKRSKRGLKALLKEIVGVICSDRYGVYAKIPSSQHQICWAHLKRDFQRLYEQSGAMKSIGRAGRRAVKEVFAVWKDFKDGRITRAELETQIQPTRRRLERAFFRGSVGSDKKTRRFCRRLLKSYETLWTFVNVEGVEPTNNHAERMVRPAVLWRKRSFGNHSQRGCRFTERILTTVQTLRLQKRPVIEYLRGALVAYRAGTKAPSLLTA